MPASLAAAASVNGSASAALTNEPSSGAVTDTVGGALSTAIPLTTDHPETLPLRSVARARRS